METKKEDCKEVSTTKKAVKTPSKAKRTSVNTLLKSTVKNDVLLGVTYKLADAVRKLEKDDKSRRSISNQMNVIKRALERKKEHFEIVEKKLNKAVVQSALEGKATTATKKVFNDIYQAIGADGRVNSGGQARIKAKEEMKNNTLKMLFK